eukprot:6185202-Pleurochrysis_carterae.AAC.1
MGKEAREEGEVGDADMQEIKARNRKAVGHEVNLNGAVGHPCDITTTHELYLLQEASAGCLVVLGDLGAQALTHLLQDGQPLIAGAKGVREHDLVVLVWKRVAKKDDRLVEVDVAV